MKTIYIILPTITIGGAEKRFTQLWLAFQDNGYKNVKLTLSKLLLNQLVEIKEFENINKYKQNIEILDWNGGSYMSFVKYINQWIYVKNNCVIHFILSFPIIYKVKNIDIIYTYPGSNLTDSNIKGMMSNFYGFLFADKIDILNPNIAQRVKNIFFWKTKKIFTTPGSVIDLTFYEPAPIDLKKNWLVFSGRFVEIKQVLKLLYMIPMIHNTLIKNGINNIRFYFLGEGEYENEMRSYIKSNSDLFRKIDIKIEFHSNPQEILKYSKIFFSLQKYSNYPSKSLLEAIACGNLPIVTDIGETRKIANEKFSYYVPEDFQFEHLIEKCLQIFMLSSDEFNKRICFGREFLNDRFSVNNSTEYFKNIYSISKKDNIEK